MKTTYQNYNELVNNSNRIKYIYKITFALPSKGTVNTR